MIRKLFQNLLLISSIIIFSYVFYKSEIIWNGIRRDFYINYYYISISIFLIFLLSLFLKKNYKTYINITFLSIIFSLYLYEAYLSMSSLSSFELKKKSKIYKIKTGKNYDTRSKFQVYKELKEKDENVTVTAPPGVLYVDDLKHSIFPLSGKSYSRTIVCNENGYYSSYMSDRYGFNNPDYVWDKNEIEYLIIGDSLAYGECVNRPNDIASVLRKLSNKNVINLGYGSNGPIIEYATLKEYFPKNTKNIIWLYSEVNDLFDITRELKNKTLSKYYNDNDFSQNLIKKQDLIDNIVLDKISSQSKINNQINYKTAIIKFVKLNNLRNFISPYEHKPTDEFIELFKKIKKFSNQNNANIYFVYMPGSIRYLAVEYDQYYEEIKQIIKNLNINIIDVHSGVFEKEDDPLDLFPFRMLGHYTINGYKKAAELIYKEIKNEQ